MKNVTPADFTIIVKNIPRGLDTDYKKEIKDLFRYKATD